ncbi:AcrR family transcriptional regulator [Motilibacter peucedani]|uniref:AcrR family transcriptional regulator n=1 Tax=Motilibacter peucedani TaxID=598650 RepID=A0A420XSY0_9ACTN|nr:TetR/AcrR family transcriptional regulator [Motilibacter peucedani]RKS79926.1 AcrR family transcriptional regulator [Motilibacter peucedani]
MPRRRSFGEAEAVLAAREAFWEHGYTATSLADLQAATGLSKSSLYEAFGSKRGLFQRALESYLAEILHPLLTPIEAEDAGVTELAAYFASLGTWLRSRSRPDAARGCLVVNTTGELNALDPAARGTVSSYRERACAAMRRCLQTLKCSAADADKRVDQLITAQFGIAVMARLDPSKAADVADDVAKEILSWSSNAPTVTT